MSRLRLVILLLFLFCSICCKCQQVPGDNNVYNSFTSSVVSNVTDSGKYITSYIRTGCKGFTRQVTFIPADEIVKTVHEDVQTILPKQKIRFLTIHGNVSYDYIYRSKIDTPLNQRDFQQHTERVSFDLLFKDKYPFKVSFTARQSNSPFFKNFADPNLQFDRFKYSRNLKQDLIGRLKLKIPAMPDLKMAEAALKEELDRFKKLKARLESPSTLQKIIEERERAYAKEIAEKSSSEEKEYLEAREPGSVNAQSQSSLVLTDSSINSTDKELGKLSKIYNSDKSKVDAAYATVQKIQHKVDSLQNLALNHPDLKSTLTALAKKKANYDKLKTKLDSSDVAKKVNGLKGKKEKLVETYTAKKDSLLAKPGKLKDSVLTKVKSKLSDLDSSLGVTRTYNKEKERLDSIHKRVERLQKRVDSLKNIVQKDLASVKQKISKAGSQAELKRIAREHGIDMDSSRGKFERKLAFIKQFNIGRSMVDYTELTAQNILISGVNIEYNPSYYVAFAAGKIDYRFRDFFNKNAKKNNQYLVLGRLGFGNKERRALIFTVYQGRKNQSEFAQADSVANSIKLMGYSVEAIVKKDENTSLSAEFAKSTKPIAGSSRTTKETNNLLRFSDQSNMGINIKAQTIIPETNSRLSGFFRRTGENFQSFSLFSYNTDQTAWMARLDQSLFKSKLTVTGMLRQNDFTNPFAEQTFKTTTVFKSVLVNVRVPKYPSVSVGYYPGTQIYYIDKERIRENAYYILNGTVVYSYYYKRIGMNTSFVYNHYNNKATDSGFVAYKGINYYASQTIFLRRLQLQGGYSYTKQPELHYYTLETSGDYSFKKILKVGAGLKYNKVKDGHTYIGERALLSASFKLLGTLQLQYEKSFLPTTSQTLYPVEMGRLTWYKSF